MINQSKSFDAVVVGGGAAGMMAALAVKHHDPNHTVIILDQSKELGRKLTITGAGRGNLTNSNLAHTPEKYFYGNQNFITSIFTQFGYTDIIRFYHTLGIPTYEETKTNKGKIFPVIDHAKTVRDILKKHIEEQGIFVACDTRVTNLTRKNNSWTIQTDQGIYTSTAVILATGGKTYQTLGSDGSGYTLAQSLGHTIIHPVVSAVPLLSKNILSHLLQGEKYRMSVTAYIGGKPCASTTDDVLFTNYGFSGSAILDISRDISVRINRENTRDIHIQLSFFPSLSPKEVEEEIQKRFAAHPMRLVAETLWGLLPKKLAGAVCATTGVSKTLQAKDISEHDVQRLVSTLTAYRADITGTRGWNEAEFTTGGIDTNEIHYDSLESKKIPGLFFAGEIIDVDGPVGGYNLSWSLASGWVAGSHAHHV